MERYNELENMMLNILDFGEEQISKDIELIVNPIERCQQRNLYFIALEKLNKKLKGE